MYMPPDEDCNKEPDYEELTPDQRRLAERMVAAGGLLLPENAEAAVRAGFCCEYCGTNMLGSVDVYAGWHWDHIVPKSKKGSNGLANKALACGPCNYIKGKYNPRRFAGPDATRKELIEVAKAEIIRRRARKQRDYIDRYLQVLREHESAGSEPTLTQNVNSPGPLLACA
jgi:5-methylcytosine-specific restriction endonuclease McrA